MPRGQGPGGHWQGQSVTACATHGLLSGPAIQRIADSVIDEVVFLDTIRQGKAFAACEDPLHLCYYVFAETISPSTRRPLSPVCSP